MAKLFPINELLRKGTKFKWEPQQDSALEEIKRSFEKHVFINHPNFNGNFKIRCDASILGIFAILGQDDEKGYEGIVDMCSRGLKDYERRYTTTELELLAVVFASGKFRKYILGFPTILYTDHQALTFMRQCENLSSRIKRWALAIEEYDLMISHIQGKDNGPADYLSRNIHGNDINELEPEKVIIAVMHMKASSEENLMLDLRKKTNEEPQLRELIRNLELEKDGNEQYRMFHSLIFKKNPKTRRNWVLVVPQECRKKILTSFQDEQGHPGSCEIC